ncbi:unnamed protein product [Phytomonas sp. EM1]|nr:unnamed protein product [Phytomonas sp. EM1]|eukprot:CCW59944.1 unnamed protein product [Phytomonas sp. isolate EM1]
MSSLNLDVAAQAISENYYLRTRLRQMEDEDQKSGTFTQVTFVNTKTLENLKRRNEELHSTISELEKELVRLRGVNVTELCHEYLHLDQRRSYLNNENISLRNILSNQKRDVKRATNAINFCQEKRRQNDAQNELIRLDIEMFRRRRKGILEEIHDLSQKERRLESELQFLSTPNEQIEKEIQKVMQDNMKKDQKIEKLTHDLEVLEKGEIVEESEGDDEEIENLRNEYVYLKEQLKAMKK